MPGLALPRPGAPTPWVPPSLALGSRTGSSAQHAFHFPHPRPFPEALLEPRVGPGFLHHPSQFPEYHRFFHIPGGSMPSPDVCFLTPCQCLNIESSLSSLLTFLACPFICFPTHLFICLFVHPSIHSSKQSYIRLSISLSNCPLIHSSVSPFIHSPICLSTCPSSHLCVHRPAHSCVINLSVFLLYIQLSICPPISPFIHLLIHPSTYSSLHPSIHLSYHPFTYPSPIHPSTHLLITSSIHPLILLSVHPANIN